MGRRRSSWWPVIAVAIIAIVAVTWIQQQDAKEVTWDDLVSIDKDAAETANRELTTIT